MPAERRWTDADRELVAHTLLHGRSRTADEEAAEVLYALTAAGWRNLSRVSGYEVDGEIYDPRDVEILTRPEGGTDAR